MTKMKNVVGVFVLLALFLPLSTDAKDKSKIDDKKLKAENIQIHEKKYLPVTGKGKPTGKPGTAAPFSATGTLGDQVLGERYAVVVGVCDYPGTANDICKSDGDAWNMNDALLNRYGFNPANVYLLRDSEAKYGSIAGALNDILAKVTPQDEIIFFFSGHGTTANVADGDKENIDEGIVVWGDNDDFNYIWDGQLKSWFSNFPNARNIFIFDSCKAGGMNDVAKDGRVVVMSSAEKENSFVYTQGEYGEGLFSHFFVKEGMLDGLADSYNTQNVSDTKVALEEAAMYAKEKVSWFANTYLWHSQTVNINDLFLNDLLF